MKKISFLLATIGVIFVSMTSCKEEVKITKQKSENKEITEAEATLDSYKALYVINSSDDKRVKGALRNMNNALEDPRLKGKLKLELIVFSDGVEIYKKGSAYHETLKMLHDKGVVLAQCENTLDQRKIDKSELYPFISYVPTGNGEIILRHYEGWAVIHP